MDAPFPNESLSSVLLEQLEDVSIMVVGNFIYKTICHIEGKAKRLPIHAIRALKNVVGEILAVQAHHCAAGNANGGGVFALLEDRVNTSVVTNGVLGKAEPSNESMLVVHSTARGLNAHARLLDELNNGGENGVPAFKHVDLSHADKNAAKESANFASYTKSFNDQKMGATIGLVLPKNMEGTDKFCTNTTKVVVLGPSDGVEQARGRFDRPSSLVNGARVRNGPTEIIHLESKWAVAVFSIDNIDMVSVLDMPVEVKTLLDSIREKYDSVTCEIVGKMAMSLFIASGCGVAANALLPGKIVEMFFCAFENRNEFMMLAEKDENGGDVGENGTYWSTVAKYAGDESCNHMDDDGCDEGGES